MTRLHRLITTATTSALLAIASAASAATFRFAAEQPNYTAAPSATVSVKLFLVEADGPYLGTTGEAGQNGLFSFGFDLTQNGVTANITGVTIPNTFLPPTPLVLPAQQLTIEGDRNYAQFSAFEGPMPVDGRILLATLAVTAPMAGSATFTIADDGNPLLSRTITYGFETLDDLIADGSFTINVTAVPEPAGAMVLLVATAIVASRRCK